MSSSYVVDQGENKYWAEDMASMDGRMFILALQRARK